MTKIYCFEFEFEFAAGKTAPALLLCVVNSHQAVRDSNWNWINQVTIVVTSFIN